jgi:hypothetical protein
MHAKVVTTLRSSSPTDEAVCLCREAVVPDARQPWGYEGGRLLTDRRTSKGISIPRWEAGECGCDRRVMIEERG